MAGLCWAKGGGGNEAVPVLDNGKRKLNRIEAVARCMNLQVGLPINIVKREPDLDQH